MCKHIWYLNTEKHVLSFLSIFLFFFFPLYCDSWQSHHTSFLLIVWDLWVLLFLASFSIVCICVLPAEVWKGYNSYNLHVLWRGRVINWFPILAVCSMERGTDFWRPPAGMQIYYSQVDPWSGYFRHRLGATSWQLHLCSTFKRHLGSGIPNWFSDRLGEGLTFLYLWVCYSSESK